MKKVYIVKKDSLKTGLLGMYVKVQSVNDFGFPSVRVIGTKLEKTVNYNDLEDVTGEYYTKSAEIGSCLFLGVGFTICLGTNIHNEGNWMASVACAILGFTFLTIAKIINE